MTLPNRSIRIDPAHADVLSALLGHLRAGRVDEVRAALAGLHHADPQAVGPFRNAQVALDFLLGRMVTAAHPQAIWLFGSRARGDARPDSDFDLLAIFPDEDSRDLDSRRHQLADAVMGTGIGTDIAVCSASEFAACRDMAGSLIRSVHEHGREVYVAPAERRRRREAA